MAKPKRKRPIFSAQRSLEWMRRHGWRMAAKVERWVPQKDHPGGGIRVDLWGCFDVVALSPAGKWVMVQSCSGSGGSAKAAHLGKLSAPNLREAIETWCAAPDHGAELWWWRPKLMRKGVQRKTWQLERTDLLTGLVLPADSTGSVGASPAADEAGLFQELSNV